VTSVANEFLTLSTYFDMMGKFNKTK
jgi:hypothetical protein